MRRAEVFTGERGEIEELIEEVGVVFEGVVREPWKDESVWNRE